MKKDKLSNKSTKFIKRNAPCYENARNYIINLCNEVFDIKNYEFKNYIENELALWIYIDGNTCVVYLDYEYIELKLVINNKFSKIFRGDSAWYRALKYISEDSNYEHIG